MREQGTNSERDVLVTCGLPYANGKAHIGHLRTYIPADIYVRVLRKQGRNPLFVCGSDTHGTPIVINAEKEGLTPKELVEIYHSHFQEIFRKLNISFDYYGSTDSPTNHARTHDIVMRNMNAGYIYPKKVELAYCPVCDRFLPDRYVEGICPHCGAVARGDECDQGCGAHLEPGEIKEPKCKICGNSAEYREQEHFFFRLSAFRDFLLDYLDGVDGTPHAINYAKEWVRRELKDWCITRNLEWGVRFPGRDDLVVYVWVDAPIGYISFTEEWCEGHGEDWKGFWMNGKPIVHFIGLDIVYHHCIFWPSLLKGAGYGLPSAIVASGMVKIEDKTFSKSRGYVVWVEDDYLKNEFDPDVLRYYIASYTSHTKDLNFSWKMFAEKNNQELVASLGNFIHRTLTFAYRNFGAVPNGNIDDEIMEKISKTIDEVIKANERYEFKQYCDLVMALADFGNSYFQKGEPWKKVKEDEARCREIIKGCLQLCKALCILFEPVIPSAMERAFSMMGFDGSDVHRMRFDDALVELESGTKILKPTPLFRRIEDADVKRMENILNERIGKKETKIEITYEDFKKLDIRVGVVKDVERIKGANRLLKLNVDMGDEVRTIVAGIGECYRPDDLIGREVIVVANMRPTKFFGVVSEGMLLAVDDNGTPIIISPERRAGAGKRVK